MTLALVPNEYESGFLDNVRELTAWRLPHSTAMEIEARRVIERAYAYSVSDPERLASARRVVARNTEARARESEIRQAARCACGQKPYGAHHCDNYGAW